MTEKLTRRDFIKLVGATAAASTILTGCGPASRYVVREPYTQMPEYTYNGQNTYYATTCRECPAGCGIVVKTHQGRALKVEGNKNHPVNLGKTCARGQAAIQGLYNPDRVKEPLRQNGRGSNDFTAITWEQAITVVKESLSENKASEIGFLLGLAPDHLADLVSQITASLGVPSPVRYSAQAMFDSQNTLAEAAGRTFGRREIPIFDISNADVLFSFGANFLETWLSPVALTRGYSNLRKKNPGQRGYLVQFESRLSQTASKSDEWLPVAPGTEGQLALALGRLVAEIKGGVIPQIYLDVNVEENVKTAGMDLETLRRLASILANANNPLVIIGGMALAGKNALETSQAILALNILLGNLGQTGGVYLETGLPIKNGSYHLPSTYADLTSLVEKMKAGKIKVLFIHGTNPSFELPRELDFDGALSEVKLVISFASFPDETAMRSDFIFPDHTSLESWGYHHSVPMVDRPVLSGSQPVVIPFYNTKATADVLLAATQSLGGKIVEDIPAKDEVEFIQQSLVGLVSENGLYKAQEINTFWAKWQQYGGWWNADPNWEVPSDRSILSSSLQVPPGDFVGKGEFFFHVYPSPLMGDGSGANKPWLQETPDPMTTVMWNSWIEINPKIAEELGLHDNDIVRIISPYGEIEAAVYRYPAIRPDVVAMPFGQGHTAYGRYAQGRGANPAILLPSRTNLAGELAYCGIKVTLQKTGKTHELARNESRLGVYGEE